jgi:hypothetical protein
VPKNRSEALNDLSPQELFYTRMAKNRSAVIIITNESTPVALSKMHPASLAKKVLHRCRVRLHQWVHSFSVPQETVFLFGSLCVYLKNPHHWVNAKIGPLPQFKVQSANERCLFQNECLFTLHLQDGQR